MYNIFKNFTQSSSDDNENQIMKQPILAILIIIYTIIIIFGTVGNSVIFYIFLTNIKLRNVRNAFMANLAISNILLITICTPSYLIQFMNRNWIFGTFWCKFLNSLQIIIILVSAFSIMMISIDRWMCIVYSHSRHFRAKDTMIVIGFIWFVSILLALPTFVKRRTLNLVDNFMNSVMTNLLKGTQQQQQQQLDGYSIDDQMLMPSINVHNYTSWSNSTSNSSSSSGGGGAIQIVNNTMKLSNFIYNFSTTFNNMPQINYCFEEWHDITHKRIYILILFCVEFVLPCVCMLITYIWIIKFLKRQHTRMSHYELLRKRLIQKNKPHKKSCKLLSSICLTFIVCCLPLSIFNIFTEFELDKMISVDEDDVYSILTILTTMVAINCSVCPLLYGWMNQNFRCEIVKLLYKHKYERLFKFNKKIRFHGNNKDVEII